MLCHTRKSKRPEWKQEYRELHSDTLWRVLRDYDMDVQFGRNHVEDRYRGIKPFAYNMWSYDGSYFNASTIQFQLPSHVSKTDAVVVAMQAPLPTTMDHFVRAVVSEGIDVIITLGASVEGQRKKMECKKMEPYWNGYKSAVCKIEQAKETATPIGVVRHLQFIMQADSRSQPAVNSQGSIVQYHLDDWLDHSTPDPKKFKALVKHIAPLCCFPKPRVVVHCSAGVGRTGTLISALRCYLIRTADPSYNQPTPSREMSTLSITKENTYEKKTSTHGGSAHPINASSSVDVTGDQSSMMQVVFESVAIVKEQRFLSVESKEQFEFLTSLSFP